MAIAFPQWVIDSVVRRQGKVYRAERLEPRKLAFVVIDMQNYFLRDAYQGAVPAAAGTIPVINALAQAVRSSGGTVVWIQTNSTGADTVLSIMHAEGMTPARRARRLAELHPSSEGYRLHEDLDVRAGDVRVDKICYSAMVQGSSELPKVLRSLEVDTLLIGGTVTNVCCDSTARDAMMQNFRTIMVDDAMSAFSVEEHEAALQNWFLNFGDVMSSEQVGRLLQQGKRSVE